MQFDLVIRGGELADGDGGPLRPADVAVADGRIVAVGQVAGRGREEIDARGKLETPGFVDIHTHYDGQATWDSRLQPSSWHGVTTAVMGNCGVGFAPVRAQHRDRLIELMEGVEDIPGAALHEGLSWQWDSFGDYLDALDQRPRDIDVAAQLPHGALRVYVMGERGARLEAATEDDLRQMRQLSAEAVRAGAIGFSTSRSVNHRSITGDPTPSLRATEAELRAIALGLQDAGRGVLQFISDFNVPSLQEEFAMLTRLVQVSGRPMSFSLAQPENGLRLPCRPSSTPIGRGATWATIGSPRACASSTSASSLRQTSGAECRCASENDIGRPDTCTSRASIANSSSSDGTLKSEMNCSTPRPASCRPNAIARSSSSVARRLGVGSPVIERWLTEREVEHPIAPARTASALS